MGRMRLLLAVLLWGASAPLAAAQTIATSAGPDSVSVTVYRDPGRGAGRAMNLSWLSGFALITETRRIAIPAGEAEIRFEGVAGGILPESAIIDGFPKGVLEKNQDARLLSPGNLLDASLGRRVHIRRIAAATGIVTESEAVIRSGADGAVVLETPGGIEALRCDGLPATLVYGGVPTGLSARPTLSVRVRSDAASEALVSLSYLATGFDWQADYVAELSEDSRRMDLFAWLTLANGDETGFVNAGTQAVAGRLNRKEGRGRRPRGAPIRLSCWPAGTTTSDLGRFEQPRGSEDIMVTASRMPVPVAMMMSAAPAPPPSPMAHQEELGDLKLYRIPEPVTVAAKSQKQVALLRRESVPVALIYRQRIWREGEAGAVPVVTARNRAADRLGLALPAGGVAFFQQAGGRRILVGRGHVGDHAVGEDVEIEIGESTDVRTRVIRETGSAKAGGHYVLTVTNAKNRPVRFEGEIEPAGSRIISEGKPLAIRDGRPLWRIDVPANGKAELRYRLEPQR